ncbi:MAG: flagellin [Lachnospiraceae bacterium]|nr:flagellin [Lachnospiraceae bacterium]
MSGISSVDSMNMYQSYSQLSSGKRIVTAADDPAGMVIAKKLESQSNGYDVAKDNAANSKNMVNVAEGALSSISDSLQRMRELSVSAKNTAVYGDSQREAMQAEIDELKKGINDVIKNTQFNTHNLLDGSVGESHVASNPDGTGMDIEMPSYSLASLGIEDYDVTGDFSLETLDKAIESITAERGKLGAVSNRLDNAMNFNSYASYNLTESQSRIEDLDIPKAISDMKKDNLIEQYKIMMMKKKMEEDKEKFNTMLF